jgi:hypothetical protein
MDHNAAFAPAGGIQELSFDEIDLVGGADKAPQPPKSTGDKIRDAGKKVAKMIPGKRDDYLLIAAAEGLAWLVDWATSDEEN